MYDINLYPPIFNSAYVPAFAGTKVRIYFELSPINTRNDLYNSGQGVQVSIRKQKNNENALVSNYRSQIMTKTLGEDTTREGNDKFYIEINSSDITGGFVFDQYYKVQIRFTGSGVTSAMPASYISGNSSSANAAAKAFSDWLSENSDYFSEWSTVVLIRQISQPTFSVKINNNSNNSIAVNTDYLILTGQVTFAGGAEENERLEKYHVYVLNSSNNIIQDSQDIYVTENDGVEYIINTSLPAKATTYTVKVVFTTNNLYVGTVTKTLTYSGSGSTTNQNLILQEIVNNSTGCIALKLTRNLNKVNQQSSSSTFEYYTYENESLIAFYSLATIPEGDDTIEITLSSVQFDRNSETLICLDNFTSNFLNIGDRIIIRRASSKNNFEQWNSLSEFTIGQNNLTELRWFDYTAEPGIWYRYQVVHYDGENTKTELVTDINKPVMLDTEDIFLNANGEELIIRFDPSISSFSTKIAESITDTIGSPYPFFRRNGNVNYKTFSLSGTISCFMDAEDNVFNGSRKDLYGESTKYYTQYNQKHNINNYNDFIYERFFREKVMNFLQSSDVKLLRSLTEGNILVKLSNISFTPNQTLGRRIYNFSCTASEVAECNEKNYLDFNILKDDIALITKQDKEG